VDFQILNYQGAKEDLEIVSLLTRVFVEEGYTDKSNADRMFAPAELQKRGEIMLARSPAGKLLGMVIFVLPTSPARRVAEADEAEIHLLAVHNEVRGQGIALRLIVACEQRAISCGYFKIVLSTQQTMKGAHHVYERLGYLRIPARDWSKKESFLCLWEIAQDLKSRRFSALSNTLTFRMHGNSLSK
jgi:ribosomal protein S18 acetylase RimI-like enzyme